MVSGKHSIYTHFPKDASQILPKLQGLIAENAVAKPFWQLNGFNHILGKSGGDQVLTTSTLIRDHPERGEEREVPQGESDGSQPQDSLPDDSEAGMTFWSISGNYMYRHHVEPRVKLDVSKELSCNHCTSTGSYSSPVITSPATKAYFENALATST